MMLIVEPKDRKKYQSQLEEHFRVRHEIYVKERGWKGLDRSDGREIDQFDCEETIYFLRLNSKGRVIGGSRLLPTTVPTLLSEVFPHLVEWEDIPCDPFTYEHTRYFAKGCPEDKVSTSRVSGEVLCAIFEYCLAHGIETVTTVCDTFFLPMILEFEWGTRPLGLPAKYEEGECVAIQTPVSFRGLQSIYATRHIDGPVLPELLPKVAQNVYMRGEMEETTMH